MTLACGRARSTFFAHFIYPSSFLSTYILSFQIQIDWHTIFSKFRFLAKYADERFEADVEWDHLKAKVEEYSSECDTKQEAMLWLDALWVKRQKWIAQCTWQHCTWGIHSTQRAEATQASVKRARLANASISKLTGALIELNTKRRQKQDVDDIRATVRHAAGTEYQSALLVDLRARLTPFAFELCAAQMKLALSYTCTAESTAGTYLVTYGGAAPVTSNTPVMNELGERPTAQ